MAAPTWAEFTSNVTGNMGTATRYMSRGIKQSDADIIFNGGLDFQGPMGLYAGAWAYTGSIEDFDTSEGNVYAGFAFSVSNISFGLGVIHYERGRDSEIGAVTQTTIYTYTDLNGNEATSTTAPTSAETNDLPSVVESERENDPCAEKINCLTGLSNTEYNVNISWDAYRLSSYQDEETKNEYHQLGANYALWGDSGLALTAGLTQLDESKEEAWDFSVSFVKAMPSNVDFEVSLLHHNDKGNTLTFGLSQQFDF